jgi:ribosomal protein S7
VDKNVRKYSRGKSGKYSFVWRYIPSYKRRYLAFRWVIKDIRFNLNKSFSDRIFKTLLNLVTEPEKSFAWKSKNYTYAYIFKNFRKSLMHNLRTTSK